MVTSTVIYDSFVESIDTSSSVDAGTQSQPKQTTILFNTASGHPVATSTKANQPTPGVTSTPYPFSLDGGMVPGATVSAAATSTGDPSSGQRTSESHLTTAVLGIGVAVVSIILLGTIYWLYMQVKRLSRVRAVSKMPQPPTTPSDWSTSPLSSPNSLEKGGKSPSITQTRPTTPRQPAESSAEKTSCHVVQQDNRQQTEQRDRSNMTSPEDYLSHLDEKRRRDRAHETASIGEERRFRLKAPTHSPRPQKNGRERSQTLPAYDNSSLPPLPQQGPAEVRELTSILKRPSNAQADDAAAAARGSGKGWLGSVQARFGAEREIYTPTFAEEKPPVGRRGVTFAGYQIREFGRTPTVSRTASIAGGSTDER